MLQVEGYNVSSCGRGDEALDLVRRARYDVILVDLYMTPVAGMEILKAALATEATTIVVVMTGNPSVASSIDALREGAWDYLPKPFSGTHLQVMFGRAVHAVLQNRHANDARQQLLTDNGNSDRITLLGVSPAFRRAVDLAVDCLAPARTGTGGLAGMRPPAELEYRPPFAQLHPIAVAQASGSDPLAVDKRAEFRFAVAQDDAAILQEQLRVLTRHVCAGDANIAFTAASERSDRALDGNGPAPECIGDDQARRHGSRHDSRII